MAYTVKLPHFEGPFDLLLFFIERDELDIYNIPIATITKDFLDYIHMMESLNIDIASEFILVASTLMRIKAKMLLPRRELDETGNEIDPREELVTRLMEYKRYKSVIDELKELEATRQSKNTRGNVSQELKQLASKALVDAEWESLTLFKLLKTFEKVMQRMEAEKNKPKHVVIRYNYTLKQQQTYLLETVQLAQQRQQKSTFSDLFRACENRIHAIFRFLALLELIQLNQLSIVPSDEVNQFWIALYQEVEDASEQDTPKK